MWIADGWEDYELLDCGGGEKLERWGKQILVRPDPQAIWETPRTNRGWRNAQGRYYRSSSGGGHWDKEKLPESWTVNYKDLKFQVKPMNFKHTGLHRRRDGRVRGGRRSGLPRGCGKGHGQLGARERACQRPFRCAGALDHRRLREICRA